MNRIDITLTLSDDLPNWPGDRRPTIERLRDVQAGDGCSVTRLDSHVHCGTTLESLGNGAIVVEGLDLRAAPPDQYNLICLPVKLGDGDGASVRAILESLA